MLKLMARLSILLISILILGACHHQPIRDVASTPNYNAQKLNQLKLAAQNGVLFLFNDSVLKDESQKQIESCRISEGPIWSEAIFNIAEIFEAQPLLYKKIHFIEIKRADTAAVKIEKENEITKLVVQYSKKMKYEKMTNFSSMNCDNLDSSALDRPVRVTYFEWPAKEIIINNLASSPDRSVANNFNTQFLEFLAERMTILRVSNDLISEKNNSGEYTLPTLINSLSQELASKVELKNIDFWMKEISVNSRQANNLEVFALKNDYLLNYGIKVDSAGKFSRKINNFSDPTYLYLSYKQENSNYVAPKLQDLNLCLEALIQIYKTQDFTKSFEQDKDSYLYPGYQCQLK